MCSQLKIMISKEKLYLFALVLNIFINPAMLSLPIEYSSLFSASNDNFVTFPQLEATVSRREKNTNFSGVYHGELYTSFGNQYFDKVLQSVDMSNLLSYETVWRSGKRVTTKVKIHSPNKYLDKLDNKDQIIKPINITLIKDALKKRKKRRRRMVYGSDDRSYIPASLFGQRKPYSCSVRISTGCTGVLISPRHVLTAAHCVHDQKDFVNGIKDLKVGLLTEGSNWKWIDVQNVRISKGWVDGDPVTGPCFDYALLRLTKKHNRPYLDFRVSPDGDRGVGERIYFSSFEDDKPQNTMWYRSCSIESDDSHFLYHFCDAWRGSSGSGVYSWQYNENDGRWERQLIAIFTGNRWKSEDEWFLTAKNFNAAVKITPSKYVQLCKWLGKYGKKLCSQSKDGSFQPPKYD